MMNDRVPYATAPKFNRGQYHTLPWFSLQCELVTPLYGGGVEEQTVDIAMPVRVSAIRGQLRFWFRLLAKHKWPLHNAAAIRRAECAIWGGMSDESADSASQFLLRVNQPKIDSNYLIKGHDLIDLIEKQYRGLSYALFPLKSKLKGKKGGGY